MNRLLAAHSAEDRVGLNLLSCGFAKIVGRADVGREFGAALRRNARPEARELARVVPLGDLGDFVQTGDDSGIAMGHMKFDKIANGAELGAKFLD